MRNYLETEKHLITSQAESEENFLAELRSGNYTIENPFVLENPYLINPLAALIGFNTKEATTAQITVKGKAVEADISHTFAAATEHVLPIYGLYDDFENTVVITLGNGRTSEVKIKVAEVNVNKAQYCKTTPEYFGKDLMIISGATYPIESVKTSGFDYAGDLRWVLTTKASWDIKKLANGRLILSSPRALQKPYYTIGLIEIDFSGKIYTEFRLPGGHHHDNVELENGNILACSDNDFNDSAEDFIVEIDRETGKVVKSWDVQKMLPREEGKAGDWDHHDWFHNNSVWYDKKTNSITLSGRHQDAVINYDYETGELNWIIGDPEGWGKEMQKYFFKNITKGDFDWQYEQHAASILPNGDVFVFDNGTWRSKTVENRVPPAKNFSRGVIYKIDTEKMEIEQVWQYGKERGCEFYSPYICNTDYYADGHYMIHSGGIASYRGQHTDGLGAMLLNKYKDEHIHLNLESITVEVLHDEVKYELKVQGGNYYRARRVALYDEKTNFALGKGKLLGEFGITPVAPLKPKFKDAGTIPEKHNLSLVLEEDRLALRGTFIEGSEVFLELKGQDKSKFYSIPTNVHDVNAACISIEAEQENQFQFYLSNEGLSGNFDIYLNIDNNRYDTNSSLKF
ncbi:Arylsulfotransferase (ASST) [Desulfitobacterium dichloroeliminans LMG P-21439]|uniref:Arylsulfotransferase (ASST) n=1 Tax=Desulfitobacterium dichloroeliminans (strain LMG P-21439 / DCA1) TaxID=871963 RepID=L0F9E1_DESDL|nr:aryl-sulfate sulfotransferase [Desulfitobacterium dichloroeliminans]AGA69635.1 Arylsulfotransferase (ASST) [Desulfitobacterium dichloroeliminans LMG P-21439]